MSSASAAILAGCQDGGDSTDEPETDTPAPTATETGTDTVTATPEPPAGVRLPAAALTEFELAVVGFETVSLDDEGGS